MGPASFRERLEKYGYFDKFQDEHEAFCDPTDFELFENPVLFEGHTLDERTVRSFLEIAVKNNKNSIEYRGRTIECDPKQLLDNKELFNKRFNKNFQLIDAITEAVVKIEEIKGKLGAENKNPDPLANVLPPINQQHYHQLLQLHLLLQ